MLTIHKVRKKIKGIYYNYYNRFLSLLKGMNSADYWNSRFSANWERSDGRLQTALFATAFALLDEKFEVASILDYGCGCGDSLPVLRMKYPHADLYYYDFSAEAMNRAGSFYANIAKPMEMPTSTVFDLVYCSNVIEHIAEPVAFCRELAKLAGKYVVIQVPYDQRHSDGALLSPERNLEEHISTINESILDHLKDIATWKVRYGRVPFAWNQGEQAFFIGEIRQENVLPLNTLFVGNDPGE